MATGTVVRFDARRGYGFVQPDDGGQDVFVHQNNINSEGFRYLQVGERVNYELEVGEKGMKAVSVTLAEPRAPRPPRPPGGEGGFQRRERDQGPRQGGRFGDRQGGGLGAEVDRLRAQQERLIALLIEKGIVQPGELDAQGGPAADGQ